MWRKVEDVHAAHTEGYVVVFFEEIFGVELCEGFCSVVACEVSAAEFDELVAVRPKVDILVLINQGSVSQHTADVRAAIPWHDLRTMY